MVYARDINLDSLLMKKTQPIDLYVLINHLIKKI